MQRPCNVFLRISSGTFRPAATGQPLAMRSPALELVEVDKGFGDIRALDGVSFAVGNGELRGFVGPNGAGKTTAMRIILGLLAPDAGVVRRRGRPIDEERRRIGYMPEERGLYAKMPVHEQLVYLAELRGFARSVAASSAGRWLERLGLADRVDDPVDELSQGNQQRVQLASALVHEPDALVLDEPFSGLDPVGVDLLASALEREVGVRGVPVLFSSHQLELVEQLCDTVTILSHGRVIADGPVGELRRRRVGRRFELDVDAPDRRWLERLSGVKPVGGAVVELDDGVDPQAVLDAARRAGRVRRFGSATPTLAELFRDVVADDDVADRRLAS
jgi:ABC-2 type transport system ATP-binding protein